MKVIHLLRKPCSEGTVAANVLRWGTGAMNIDASRIACAPGDEVSLHGRAATENGWDARGSNAQEAKQTAGQALGRWPANLVLQHLPECEGAVCAEECPVAALDAQSGPTGSWSPKSRPSGEEHDGNLFGRRQEGNHYGDFGGGASRFFKQFGKPRG